MAFCDYFTHFLLLKLINTYYSIAHYLNLQNCKKNDLGNQIDKSSHSSNFLSEMITLILETRWILSRHLVERGFPSRLMISRLLQVSSSLSLTSAMKLFLAFMSVTVSISMRTLGISTKLLEEMSTEVSWVHWLSSFGSEDSLLVETSREVMLRKQTPPNLGVILEIRLLDKLHFNISEFLCFRMK